MTASPPLQLYALQLLRLDPEVSKTDRLEPVLEPGAVALQGLHQGPARVLAQRIRHAFPEPDGLEKRVPDAAQALVLKDVNELVADEVRLPPPIADHQGDRADRVRVAAPETEFFRARS